MAARVCEPITPSSEPGEIPRRTNATWASSTDCAAGERREELGSALLNAELTGRFVFEAAVSPTGGEEAATATAARLRMAKQRAVVALFAR